MAPPSLDFRAAAKRWFNGLTKAPANLLRRRKRKAAGEPPPEKKTGAARPPQHFCPPEPTPSQTSVLQLPGDAQPPSPGPAVKRQRTQPVRSSAADTSSDGQAIQSRPPENGYAEDGVLGLRVHRRQAAVAGKPPAPAGAGEPGSTLASLQDISRLRFGLVGAAVTTGQPAPPSPGPRRRRRAVVRLHRDLRSRPRAHCGWLGALEGAEALGADELEDVVEATALAPPPPVLPALGMSTAPAAGEVHGPPTEAHMALCAAPGSPQRPDSAPKQGTMDKAGPEAGRVASSRSEPAKDPPAGPPPSALTASQAPLLHRSPSFGGFATLATPPAAPRAPTPQLFSFGAGGQPAPGELPGAVVARLPTPSAPPVAFGEVAARVAMPAVPALQPAPLFGGAALPASQSAAVAQPSSAMFGAPRFPAPGHAAPQPFHLDGPQAAPGRPVITFGANASTTAQPAFGTSLGGFAFGGQPSPAAQASADQWGVAGAAVSVPTAQPLSFQAGQQAQPGDAGASGFTMGGVQSSAAKQAARRVVRAKRPPRR